MYKKLIYVYTRVHLSAHAALVGRVLIPEAWAGEGGRERQEQMSGCPYFCWFYCLPHKAYALSLNTMHSKKNILLATFPLIPQTPWAAFWSTACVFFLALQWGTLCWCCCPGPPSLPRPGPSPAASPSTRFSLLLQKDLRTLSLSSSIFLSQTCSSEFILDHLTIGTYHYIISQFKIYVALFLNVLKNQRTELTYLAWGRSTNDHPLVKWINSPFSR